MAIFTLVGKKGKIMEKKCASLTLYSSYRLVIKRRAVKMHYCSLEDFTGTFFMSDYNSVAAEMKKQKNFISTL